MRRTLLALAVMAIPTQARADAERLSFAAYVAGLNIFRLAVGVAISTRGYRIEIAGRTTGMAGALYRAAWHSLAQGDWMGPGVRPRHFASNGVWGGHRRGVTLTYDGPDPLVQLDDPDGDDPHTPVAPGLRRDTVDSLSALALLMHRADSDGRCDGAARVFDGRRLTVFTVRTTGQQTLPATPRAAWHGVALRCDFDSRQIAGFDRDQSAEDAGRTRHGTVWLARLAPDGPPLPVQVMFESRFGPDATLYLSGPLAGADLPRPEDVL